MRAVIDIFKCAALLAVTILCFSLARSVHGISQQAFITMAKLDEEIDEMHRLTLEAGLTAMEARKASVKESAYLDQWNAQLSGTMTDVQKVMDQTALTVASIRDTTQAATATLQTTQVTVQALQTPIAQANVTLQELQPVIAHTDALVTDPAIVATLSNVASTTAHLDATSKDVQETVHSYTHPTWAHKIFSWTLDVAHALNPL